jgi:hypothetical protein
VNVYGGLSTPLSLHERGEKTLSLVIKEQSCSSVSQPTQKEEEEDLGNRLSFSLISPSIFIFLNLSLSLKPCFLLYWALNFGVFDDNDELVAFFDWWKFR